jgi:hypothetical protein
MRNFIYSIIIFCLITTSGCATGIKSTPNGKMNGSQSQQMRKPVSATNYSNFTEIPVAKGTTNIVQVQVIENGKVLTTFPVQVVTPPQNKYVQITGKIKKEQTPFNWFLTIRYSAIVFVFLVAIIYMVGWKKVKDYIVSPFKK